MAAAPGTSMAPAMPLLRAWSSSRLRSAAVA
jgi:hypothetical protein